jgi:hypothetical protein
MQRAVLSACAYEREEESEMLLGGLYRYMLYGYMFGDCEDKEESSTVPYG